MPVVIKDFEVVGDGTGAREPVEPRPTSPPQTRPLSARQVAQMMKFAKERAGRLHAD